MFVVSAADLTAYDWPSLDAMPDAELARRARVLLAVPDGTPPLTVTYAEDATGATPFTADSVGPRVYSCA